MRKFTAWCEECDLVFDNLTAANEHQEKEKHTKIPSFITKSYDLQSKYLLVAFLYGKQK